MRDKLTCKLRERKSKFVEIFRTTPPGTVCPNFYVLSHANGCTFDPQCSYCYLKSSFGHLKEQQAFTNTDRLLAEVRRWIARDKLESYLLNAGNLSDSLVFEGTRPLIGQLVEMFRAHAAGRPHTLLLVTKGGLRECECLFGRESCPNVIVTFSVNSPEAAAVYERGAATVDDRFRAARKLKRKGWRVRIRIDPMIVGFPYSATVKAVRALAPERITLGTLRAEPNLAHRVGKGLFAQHARVVYKEFGRKIVRPVYHEIIILYYSRNIGGIGPYLVCHHLDIRVHRFDLLLRGKNL